MNEPQAPGIQEQKANVTTPPTPEELKKKLEEKRLERLQRAEKCTLEIKQLLEKHNCFIDVFVTVGTNQQVAGSFKIVGR